MCKSCFHIFSKLKGGLYLKACLILGSINLENQGLDIALKTYQVRSLFYSSFFAILLAFHAAHGGWCGYELSGRKPFFEFVDHRLNMEQWERTHLGYGTTADVHLIFDKYRNKWIAQKSYKMGNLAASRAAKNQDIRAMQFLKGIQNTLGLRIAKYESHQTESSAIEMDYYQGKTLEQVLNDKKVSQEIKDSLYQRYRTALTLIQIEMLNRKFANVEFLRVSRAQERGQSHEALKAEFDFSDGMAFWFLKPDNIIVDPFTLELTVVDPR
jgi:hypothetical protein